MTATTTGGCPVLLTLAVEAVAAVMDAGAAVAGQPTQVRERFAAAIATRWGDWLSSHSVEAREAAFAELRRSLSDAARLDVERHFDRLAPQCPLADRQAALAFLAEIPATFEAMLQRNEPTVAAALQTSAWERHSSDLDSLLPRHLPPYAAPCPLPNSSYHLEKLLGCGGFGAVYRATATSLQHLPLAIKLCLDARLKDTLRLERNNLERLMQAGHAEGGTHIVRLYGYDLDHATPYLVYEFVPGGDLFHYLARRHREQNRQLDPAEVFEVVVQVARGLAFAHRQGLVHRDLKPANVLVDGEQLKLADFGLGGVTSVRYAGRLADAGSAAAGGGESAGFSMLRGAGTPLYMSPEQRDGAAPDPRHDLYSLGVMWYQMLLGDLTRPLESGWFRDAKLRSHAPEKHLDLLKLCVGGIRNRPRDGAELLGVMKRPVPDRALPLPGAGGKTPATAAPGLRQGAEQLLHEIKTLHELHSGPRVGIHTTRAMVGSLFLGLIPFAIAFVIFQSFYSTVYLTLFGVASPRSDNITRFAVCTALAFGVYVICAGLMIVRHVLRRHRYLQEHLAKIDRQVGRIVKDVPGQVARWGGAQILRDKDEVYRVLRQLRGDPLPPPRSVRVAVDASPKLKRLRRLLKLHERARLRSQAGASFHFFFPAVPLAVPFGYLMWTIIRLGYVELDLSSTTVAEIPGYKYWPIFFAGVLSAVLGWAVVVILQNAVARLRIFLAQDAVTVYIGRLLREVPEATGAWGGRHVLESEQQSRALLLRLEAEIDLLARHRDLPQR